MRAAKSQGLNRQGVLDRMQETYFACAAVGNLADMGRLENLSGIDVSQETLQKVGNLYMSLGSNGLPILKEFIEKRKDYVPDNKSLYTTFIDYLEKEKFGPLRELEVIVKTTVPLEMIIEVGAQHLKAAKYEQFNKLSHERKIQMKDIPLYLVQDASLALIKDGRLEDAQKLLEDRETEPSDEFYLTMLRYKPTGELGKEEISAH